MKKYLLYLVVMVACVLAGLWIGYAAFHNELKTVGSGNIVGITSFQKADIVKVSAQGTTTLAMFLNNDQDATKRIVREIDFITDSQTLTSTPNATTFALGTTTLNNWQLGISSSTPNLWNPTVITSTTLPQSFVTTSYSTVVNRFWNYGEYVYVTSSAAVTTTGYIKILYDKVPTK